MNFEPGEILAFYGTDLVSRAIELWTRGPSHVGICVRWGLDVMLVESTTLCPFACEIQGVKMNGVQAHNPEKRVRAYPGVVERVRLADRWRLSFAESQELTELAREYIGKPYDIRGAITSGTKAIKLFRYADLGSLFCSEIIADMLQRLSRPRMRICNPAIFNPASLIRELRRSGRYGRPEPIVAEPRPIVRFAA